MNPSVRRVEDEHGRVFELADRLSEGVQGAVFAVRGGRVAVKILHRASGSVTQDQLRALLRRVRRFPLKALPIARPLATLAAPDVGYVMEHLTGMTPLADLISPPDAGVTDWYLATGGLRRRLRLLATVADGLLGLHHRGLVFGDLSPNNVFVSKSVEHHEVRFIDADNLRFDSEPSLLDPVYAPFHGAPEVVSGRSGVNTLTDAHALAVMVFEVLSLIHPLIGDGVADGNPEDQERASTGRLPWVDDREDTRNASSRGIPRDIVLSASLRALAQSAFGDGLTDPGRRPTTGPWAERLWSAFDATIRCPHCGATWYANRTACPFCDAPAPAFVRLKFLIYHPQRDEFIPLPGGQSARQGRTRSVAWRRPPNPILTISEGEERHLAWRHLEPGGSDGSSAVMTLSLSGRRLMLTNVHDEIRGGFLVSPRCKTVHWTGETLVLNLDAQRGHWDIHLPRGDGPYRVAIVKYYPTRRR